MIKCSRVFKNYHTGKFASIISTATTHVISQEIKCALMPFGHDKNITIIIIVNFRILFRHEDRFNFQDLFRCLLIKISFRKCVDIKKKRPGLYFFNETCAHNIIVAKWRGKNLYAREKNAIRCGILRNFVH